MTHVEINDNSVEGVSHKHLPAYTVQLQQNTAAGHKDASYLFYDIMDLMDNFKK